MVEQQVQLVVAEFKPLGGIVHYRASTRDDVSR